MKMKILEYSFYLIIIIFLSITNKKENVRMKQLNDLFSVPEMCLLSNVTEYFIQNNISYYPEILYHDVTVSEMIFFYISEILIE